MEPPDAGWSPGKSRLFFVKGRVCLKPTGSESAASGAVSGVWLALENLGNECRLAPQVVPITVAGLQGEQPLVNRTM